MKTYAGIPEENATLENSKVMLVTVPYDGTSTWGKGADKGPELFLDASENMELYDIETATEPYLEGVYLAGEVTGLFARSYDRGCLSKNKRNASA